MLQRAEGPWPAEAVHDSVAAVMRTEPFRRSLQSTLLEQLLSWLGQGIDWIGRQLEGLPSGRAIVAWVVAALVLLLLGRLVLAARAREPGFGTGPLPNRARAGEDPWRAAQRLADAGDHAGAAHALYQGVLATLAAADRLRLHPSRTSGDYARELRARGSAAYRPFREFARRFDAAIYGHAPVDAQLVADLRTLAEPLRAAARAA